MTKLNSIDWGVSEHALMCKVLELAGTHDQLDVPNSAALEAVGRRLQTIEHQYRERVRDSEHGGCLGAGALASVGGKVPMSVDEAQLFEGAQMINPTICASPALIAHVARELEGESDIAKQARKAREEKTLARGATGMSKK